MFRGLIHFGVVLLAMAVLTGGLALVGGSNRLDRILYGLAADLAGVGLSCLVVAPLTLVFPRLWRVPIWLYVAVALAWLLVALPGCVLLMLRVAGLR